MPLRNAWIAIAVLDGVVSFKALGIGEAQPEVLPYLVWLIAILAPLIVWHVCHLRAARAAAQVANTAKSEFIANVSHELRTPLHGILGMVELLDESGLDVRQREMLEIVRHSAETLTATITDILAFARIEAGHVKVEHIAFSVRDSLHSAARLLQPGAAAKGLRLVVTVADAVPQRIFGDPLRLHEVLVHLLGNAVKFTDTGEIRLEAVVAGDPDSPNALLFRVVDTGIGVAPEVASRLFTPFTQADSASTRKYGGPGLGLATARRLVQLMQGSMGLDSVPGRGSTFWFLLPLEAEELEPCAPALIPASRPVPDRNGHILVVDDNPINQLVTGRTLNRLGYLVEVAPGGKEALEACARMQFDLILLDCQMPEMDGYETAREIRRRENGACRVPIIALTANAAEEQPEKCRSSGMDSYLTKPLRFSELQNVLDRWIPNACVVAAPLVVEQTPDH